MYQVGDIILNYEGGEFPELAGNITVIITSIDVYYALTAGQGLLTQGSTSAPYQIDMGVVLSYDDHNGYQSADKFDITVPHENLTGITTVSAILGGEIIGLLKDELGLSAGSESWDEFMAWRSSVTHVLPEILNKKPLVRFDK